MPSVIPAGSPVARPANNVLSMARRSLCRRHRRRPATGGCDTCLPAGARGEPQRVRRTYGWRRSAGMGALLGFAGVGVSIFGFAAGRPDSLFSGLRSVRSLIVAGWIISSFCHVAMETGAVQRGDKIVAWGDAGDTEAAAVASLALGIEENYQTNKPVIDRLFQPMMPLASSGSLCWRWPFELGREDFIGPRNRTSSRTDRLQPEAHVAETAANPSESGTRTGASRRSSTAPAQIGDRSRARRAIRQA